MLRAILRTQLPLLTAPLLAVTLLAVACQPAPAPPPEPAPPPAGPVAGTVPAADGVPIAYTEQGSGSPTLVFIHGWSCDQSYWAAQVPAFAAKYRVVTVDLPGHGASGSERSEWTLAGLGDDVRALVEGLDLRQVILVGHSMGGPVALLAAAKLPERVIGVVGVDTLQDADRKFDPAQWGKVVDAYRQDFAGTCNSFVPTMFRPDAPPELVTRVTSDMCAAPPEIAVSLFADFPNFDAAAALEAVQVPVRLINSSLYPTNIEGNRTHAPSFDAVIMDGVGHFLMMERPEEFNAHLAAVIEQIGAGAPEAGSGQP